MQQATGNRADQGGRKAAGFKGLLVWQSARELSSMVYRATKSLKNSDSWLKSQVVRAAISVSANIAEGYGRGSKGDYLRFLEIARGSLCEVENYLDFLAGEELLPDSTLLQLDEARVRTGNLLHGLIEATRRIANDSWSRGTRISDEHIAYEVD
ncbi:MAG TPA: four helix bundle protein [Dehalococcoidia bacterium]